MNTLRLLPIALIMLLLIACNTPAGTVQKLNSYINDIEQECPEYSADDWEKTELNIQELIAEIEAEYENMSPEEKNSAMKAIGRYYGIVAKQGIRDASKGLQNIFEALPSLLEGIGDAFSEE